MTSATDILTKIIENKHARLKGAGVMSQPGRLREQALSARRGAARHALRAVLDRADRINVIAEIKSASPSAGIIRADVRPSQIAAEFYEAGAAAISVLTEEDFFGGSL